METLAWSFNVMASGRFPTTDPCGQQWTDRSRIARAGTKLSPEGEIGVFSQFSGDWKFTLEELYFEQSWMHEYVCRWCFARKGAGDLNYANAAEDAGWTLCRRTNSEYLDSLSRRGLEPGVQRTLGFHHECAHDDYMHDDLLGVRLDFNGSVLRVLADVGLFGVVLVGTWQDKFDTQLKVAFNNFKNFFKIKCLQHSVPGFDHLSLSMRVLDDWPVLKCKAHNSAMVTLWLAAETAKLQHMNAYMHRVATATFGFASVWCIISNGDMILSDNEVEGLVRGRQQALLGFQWLAVKSQEQGKYLFRYCPKFHKLDEQLRRAERTKLNPSFTRMFAEESWIGLLPNLAASTHVAAVSRRISERWLVHMYGEVDRAEVGGAD